MTIPIPSTSFSYQVGGSLPVDAPAYVERQADREIYQRLKTGEYCFVFNSRQMGKSSLRVRAMQKLQEEGIACAVIDPQTRGTTLREDQWYAGTIKRLIGDLHLEKQIDFAKWWKELDAQSISVVERFAYFIEQTLLPSIPQNIVLFVEEIDNLLSLKFDTDGFFMLIRSFYEQRAEKPEYKRLTFAFLGVATPYDLIRSKHSSSFNIGWAVEMSGFTLEEAEPLMPGLVGKFSDPQAVMQEVLRWTGGQPFLTQKVLSLVAESEASSQSPQELVEQIVYAKIIDNWEAQDVPQHLKTLQERILRLDERGRGRLLGLFQQIIYEGGIEADESYEQMQLRLTGLVVKRDGKLQVYNPIYEAVFNRQWVDRALGDLRPPFYAEALRSWQEASDEQKTAFLLRGQALQDAEDWAKGKRLSDEDELFLRESREVEKREVEGALESEKQARAAAEQANAILSDAERKAKGRIRVGSVVLGTTLAAATLTGIGAWRSVTDANTRAEKTDRDATSKTQVAEQKVQLANRKVVDADRRVEVTNKEADVKQLKANQKVKEAELKLTTANREVQQADAQVVSAKAELANIDKRSKEQIAAATQKVGLAEQRSAQARQAQVKAREAVAVAELDIKLAEVRLKITEAKASFQGNQEFDALIQAVRAGQKLKILEKSVWTKNDTQRQVIQILQQSVYEVRERNRLEDHSDAIWSVAFSPDGKTIATGSVDKTVKLWSIDGKEIQTLKGHNDRVTSVAFSPDGKTIATGSWDKTVKLWSRDGRELQTFKGHSDSVSSLAFSPDGKTIATGSWDKTVKLWSRDGRELQTFKGHSDSVWSVAFSPDGKTIATGSVDKTVKLWSIDGKEIQTLKGHNDRVTSVAFSPDGKTIATGSFDKTVKLWSIDGGETQSFKGHSGAIYSVAFSPNGETVASTSYDTTVKLWIVGGRNSSPDGKEIKSFKDHNDAVHSVAFSPDGKTIATGSEDKTVKLWSLDSSEKTLSGLVHVGSSVIFSPDGKMIASADDQTVKLWSLDGRVLQTFKGQTAVAFSPDGKMIASADDQTVKLWSLDGRVLQTFKGHSAGVNSVAFSPDGKMIVTGSWDDSVKLWNLDGRELETFKGHRNFVRRVAFNPNGKMIASADDQTVKLWNIDGSELQTFKGQTAVAFSPNGKIIGSADDQTVKLWNIDGSELRTFKGNRGAIMNVAFSPDGTLVASASWDGTVKLWSIDGRALQTFKSHRGRTYGVVFSPDGKLIASTSWDGTVILWNLDFEDLMAKGCEWLHDYLSTNPNVSNEDREMCGIEARKK